MDAYENFISHVRTSQILNFYLRFQNRNFESLHQIARNKIDKSLYVYYPILYYSNTPNALLQKLLNVIFDISPHFAYELIPDKLNYNYDNQSTFVSNIEKIKSKKVTNKTLLTDFKPNQNRNYEFLNVGIGYQQLKEQLQTAIGKEPKNKTLTVMRQHLTDGLFGDEAILKLSITLENNFDALTNEIYGLLKTSLGDKSTNLDETKYKNIIRDKVEDEQLNSEQKQAIVNQIMEGIKTT